MRSGIGQDPNDVLVDLADVPLGGEAAQIVAGSSVEGGHTCALLRSGGVRCWGSDTSLGYGTGEPILLGYGTDVSRLYEPPQADVEIGGEVRDMALGVQHTCVLLDSGRVRCWGVNGYGQLGFGDPTLEYTQSIPAAVDVLPDCGGA